MLSLAASPQVQKATSASLALELLTIRRMFNLNLSLSLSYFLSMSFSASLASSPLFLAMIHTIVMRSPECSGTTFSPPPMMVGFLEGVNRETNDMQFCAGILRAGT